MKPLPLRFSIAWIQLATLLVIPSPQLSRAAVIQGCDEAGLRAALAGGGDVTFGCDGVIVLSNPLTVAADTSLDAAGHHVTISGGQAVRVFQVEPGVSFALSGLTIADGRDTQGGGILNNGGVVTLTDCRMQNNSAVSSTNAGVPAPATGGAVQNQGGTLRLVRTTFANNQALGWKGLSVTNEPSKGTEALGGAVASVGGSLMATNCVFVGNTAQGGDGGMLIFLFGGGIPQVGAAGYGGALFSTGAVVRLADTIVLGNAVTGGNGQETSAAAQGSSGGAAWGGGVAARNTDLQLFAVTVASNSVSGGSGGRNALGGEAGGGGGWSLGGSAVVESCAFRENGALAGRGAELSEGAPASGGGFHNGGTLAITRSLFGTNLARGGVGSQRAPQAGAGRGGGLFHSTGDGPAHPTEATVRDCVYQGNRAIGGVGMRRDDLSTYTPGGQGLGGAIFCGGGGLGILQLINSTLAFNAAEGGPGSPFPPVFGNGAGPAGPGFGGALFLAGALFATNSTLYANQARGGIGGSNSVNGSSSPPGPGVGGGIYSSGAGTALNLTLAANSVSGAPATSTGGNLAVVGGQFSLRNTILANSPAGGNCSGTATDAGHNLSSDATCHFSAPGSMNSVDPKLGGLEANGGPTPTLALLPQSPAIDSGDDTNCPATDQRGVSRPQRLHCDIGAYELDGSPYRITYLGRIAPERVVVLGVGPPGRTVTAQSSSDFVHWTDLGSAVVSPTGAFEIQGTADRSTRFYRATGLGF